MVEAARELFTRDGPQVPLDAIAQRAGVGPGTLHRHFPSKAVLLAEIVVEDLVERILVARRRLAGPDPGSHLFELLDGLLDDAQHNGPLKAALSGTGFDFASARPDVLADLRDAQEQLLSAAQSAGLARVDIGIDELKALLVAALAAQDHLATNPDQAARVRALVLATLEAPSPD